MAEPRYPFDSTEHERQRLIRQADVLKDVTERLFRKAGIGEGLRALDLGSGAGDVAFVARHLVGARGEVIGTDRDPAQAAFANRRAKEMGYDNVRFIAADYADLHLDAPVDCVVGRYVLIFAEDPAAALAAACRNLKLGGVVAIVENNMVFDAVPLVEPPDGLAARVVGWILAGLSHGGVSPRSGLKLFGVMRAAGLTPSPEIETFLNVQEGPEGPLFGTLVSLVRSALPAIIASGAASAEEIAIDTLEQRLIADAPASGVVAAISTGVMGVWARKP